MLMVTEVKENKEGRNVRRMARGQQGGEMAQDAIEQKSTQLVHHLDQRRRAEFDEETLVKQENDE